MPVKLILRVAGTAFFAAYLLFMLWTQTYNGRTEIFGSFWEAGRHLDYQIHPLVWEPIEGRPEINLNPPAILPLFQAFALFDPMAGRHAWLLVSAILTGAALWAMGRRADLAQTGWLYLNPLIYGGLIIGQVYFLMLLLGLAIRDGLAANRRWLAAVALAILIAFKPPFALWCGLAFAAGHYRSAIRVGALALALSALPAVLYGPEIFIEWLRAAAQDEHYSFAQEVSINGITRLVGVGGGMVLAAALAGCLMAWAYRVRPSLYDVTPVAFVGAILCSPIAWADYLLAALPFFVDRRWTKPGYAVALLCFLPGALGIASGASAVTLKLLCALPVVLMLTLFTARTTLDNIAVAVDNGAGESAGGRV